MTWWMMLFSLLIMPLLQPLTDYGSAKLQKTLGVQHDQQQTTAQPQPYMVYHNGQWWKFENNQWYVWRPQQ